jgi:hypothetical protein
MGRPCSYWWVQTRCTRSTGITQSPNPSRKRRCAIRAACAGHRGWRRPRVTCEPSHRVEEHDAVCIVFASHHLSGEANQDGTVCFNAADADEIWGKRACTTYV